MTCSAAARGAAVLIAAFAWFRPAPAQTLVVLSSNGVRAGLEALAPDCEQRVGRKMLVEYGTSSSLKERIAGGANVDVALITTEVVADLAKRGYLVPESVTPIGHAGIGVGIREGGRRYPIGTVDEIKQTLLAARSITYAQDGASRVHLEQMFAELGIAAEMKAKTLLEQGSTRAAAKVVAGEAEILLTLVSEILPVSGLELLGPLPGHFQSYVSFDAAVGTKSQDPDDARGFASCLTLPSPPTTRTWTAKGIEQ